MIPPVYLMHECLVSGEPILLGDGGTCPWCRGRVVFVVPAIHLETLMERIERLERERQ